MYLKVLLIIKNKYSQTLIGASFIGSCPRRVPRDRSPVKRCNQKIFGNAFAPRCPTSVPHHIDLSAHCTPHQHGRPEKEEEARRKSGQRLCDDIHSFQAPPRSSRIRLQGSISQQTRRRIQGCPAIKRTVRGGVANQHQQRGATERRGVRKTA